MVKQEFLRLDGFTKTERIQMTARVSEAISRAGAWITDFHQYSNILICINFEVPSANLEKFATTLLQTGLHLSQESMNQLIADDSTQKDKELVGTLQVHLYIMNLTYLEKYLLFRDNIVSAQLLVKKCVLRDVILAVNFSKHEGRMIFTLRS